MHGTRHRVREVQLAAVALHVQVENDTHRALLGGSLPSSSDEGDEPDAPPAAAAAFAAAAPAAPPHGDAQNETIDLEDDELPAVPPTGAVPEAPPPAADVARAELDEDAASPPPAADASADERDESADPTPAAEPVRRLRARAGSTCSGARTRARSLALSRAL